MSNQSHKQIEPLLDSFSAPSLDQWREEVERLLKGAPFAKKMFTKTMEGISVKGMYTEADNDSLPWVENLPGQWPFLRGGEAGANVSAPWLVAQELPLPTAEDLNNALRSDLRRGQTAINIVLDKAGLKGLDPDQAPAEMVGQRGTSIASTADLETALDGIDISTTPLFVQTGSAALPVLALLLSLLNKQSKSPADLSGCLGSDPIFGLAELGQLPFELKRIYDELFIISTWAQNSAPKLKTLPVHEDPWHEGGADSALSLGLILASGVQMLRAMEERGMPVEKAAARIQFHLCIGTDFFMEMAKVRALRLLWSDILAAAGCPAVASEIKIHARTSRRTQTLLDPHVNMLRATTQAMSAVLGGVDSLHVSPFDEVDSLPDEFSRRIARNLQLVLAHECHFDQVQDPAGGSWYVENLTCNLAEKAWGAFQECEQHGGIVEAMKTGWLQEQVTEASRLRAHALATRKKSMVGTNVYANPLEPKREARTVDHAMLKERRTEDMARQRTSGAQDEHMLVLGRLEKIIDASNGKLLDLLVDAAAHGATLGELTGILRLDTDPDLDVKTIHLRRCAEPFEKLRARVESLGPKNRIFAVCLGDVARYMPRLDFTRGFFQVGGFNVVEDGFFADSSEALEAYKKLETSQIVLVGQDETYNQFAAEILQDFKSLSSPPKVFIAGGGTELLNDLKAMGLDGSINMRSNTVEFLGQMASDLEVQS